MSQNETRLNVSLCGACPFRSPTGDVVVVVVDVAPIWTSAPHNELVASLGMDFPINTLGVLTKKRKKGIKERKT